MTLSIVNMKREKCKQTTFYFYLSLYFQQIISLHKFFSCHTAQSLLHFKLLNLKYFWSQLWSPYFSTLQELAPRRVLTYMAFTLSQEEMRDWETFFFFFFNQHIYKHKHTQREIFMDLYSIIKDDKGKMLLPRDVTANKNLLVGLSQMFGSNLPQNLVFLFSLLSFFLPPF